MGRRFVGCELKLAYFRQAVANLKAAVPDAPGSQVCLFSEAT
jgi:hypothetical protein